MQSIQNIITKLPCSSRSDPYSSLTQNEKYHGRLIPARMEAWQLQLQSNYIRNTKLFLRRAEDTHHQHQNHGNNHIKTSSHSTQITLQSLIESNPENVLILPLLIFELPSCAFSLRWKGQFDLSSWKLPIIRKLRTNAPKRPL